MVEKSSKESVDVLFSLFKLLGSGIISALGLTLIASNRWNLLDSAIVTFVILYMTWQTLGLTITKMGIDQVIFASVSQDQTIFFGERKFFKKWVFPISAGFSILIAIIFSSWAGVVAFLTIILDTHSLMIMADLNARNHYGITAFSNLLNYPLFFIFILISSYYIKLNITIILLFFLGTSLIRWIWLNSRKTSPHGKREVTSGIGVEMGLLQVFNYLMFKLDQIVLASTLFIVANNNFLAEYLFMAKFPELVSGILTAVGTILFPKLYITYPLKSNNSLKIIKQICLNLLTVFLTVIGSLIYKLLWNGHELLSWYFVIPFLVHSAFIYIVNNISYSMIRQGYIRRLLLNLVSSVISGFVIVVILYSQNNYSFLIWIVPLQLGLFSLFSFNIPWGKRKEIYVQTN